MEPCSNFCRAAWASSSSWEGNDLLSSSAAFQNLQVKDLQVWIAPCVNMCLLYETKRFEWLCFCDNSANGAGHGGIALVNMSDEIGCS